MYLCANGGDSGGGGAAAADGVSVFVCVALGNLVRGDQFSFFLTRFLALCSTAAFKIANFPLLLII